MALDPKERARRDERELSRWAPMQRAGEQIQRETRRAEAARQRQDGVEPAREERSRALRVRR